MGPPAPRRRPVGLNPVKIYRYLRHPGTPAAPKWTMLLALVYVLWPLDLVPDALPFVGWLDDAGLLALATAWISRQLVPRSDSDPESEVDP